ncbi:hypothetical protein [Paenibacillus sp. MMS20-IR301]|uniref:hypothetical protein n=1 Tax=Paenibacillus sp. MMS20-IR301 TaxID=2895946 RepID=UPI0028E2D0F4|nr:hypothetical protein [Paenibacillus sp. MMS20-IR301]WNS46526.1 hypothetical protein LOS79_15110 [Paenibacillus sp. MMS20-IR301]
MPNILSNGILTVEIADTGAYSGTRFDWTGFITGVTLEQGGHTFCVPESRVPGQGTGGIGLCNEFGISRAIGYDEAAPGEWFPKPGVGLLQKQKDEPYLFHGEYPLIPFTIHEERSGHSVTYTVEPLECRGYSMRLIKTITLNGNCLDISYLIENTGNEPLQIEEYIHNFVGINGASVGGDYELKLPGALQVVNPESGYTKNLLLVKEGALTWSNKPDRQFYCRLAGWEEADADYYWELVHKPSGAGIRESGDFAAERIALWGDTHVISPEVFADITILPRHSKGWRRSYTFFA